MEKSAIYGQNPQFGTDTKKGWYWYPLDRGKVVPVLIKVVPVPMLPAALIFVPLRYQAPNSYTDSIGP